MCTYSVCVFVYTLYRLYVYFFCTLCWFGILKSLSGWERLASPNLSTPPGVAHPTDSPVESPARCSPRSRLLPPDHPGVFPVWLFVCLPPAPGTCRSYRLCFAEFPLCVLCGCWRADQLTWEHKTPPCFSPCVCPPFAEIWEAKTRLERGTKGVICLMFNCTKIWGV